MTDMMGGFSRETIEELKTANRDCTYPEQELLQVIPQEYKVGNVNQIDPVGVMSDNIEGRYLNIVTRLAKFTTLLLKT